LSQAREFGRDGLTRENSLQVLPYELPYIELGLTPANSSKIG
jgi:hypothetical protein